MKKFNEVYNKIINEEQHWSDEFSDEIPFGRNGAHFIYIVKENGKQIYVSEMFEQINDCINSFWNEYRPEHYPDEEFISRVSSLHTKSKKVIINFQEVWMQAIEPIMRIRAAKEWKRLGVFLKE